MTGDPREGPQASGEIGDLLEGLGEIQRLGMTAATRLVEELIDTLDVRSRSRPAARADEAVALPDWSDLASRYLRAVARLTGPPADGATAGPDGSNMVTIDVARGDPWPGLRLEIAGDRPAPVAELCLRNRTTGARSDLRLHAGELRSSEGLVLSGRLRFAPAVIEELPPRSTRGVLVTVEVEERAMAGTYQGLVLVAGLPDGCLPVQVAVEA